MKKIMKLQKPFSIQFKWTLVSALTILVSYTMISALVYIAMYSWLINDEENSAIQVTEDLQAFFYEEGASITIHDIQNNSSLMKSIIDRNQTIRIYNFDNFEIIRIKQTMGTKSEKPSIEDIRAGAVLKEKIDGVKCYIVYKPVQIGNFRGYIELVHPLTKFHSMMNYMATLLLLLGAFAVVLAALFSSSIAKLLLKPIEELRNSMAQVRSEGLDAEPLVNYMAEDEIGDLVTMYNSMLDELKKSFAQQEQFIQDASHELRSPIQAIEGHLSLINRWGKEDPEILDESLQTSISEVNRMKKIIEELLMLAKNEEIDHDAYCDVNRVINEVIEEMEIQYPTAVFRYERPVNLINAKCKSLSLNQIVRNIVENAVRYSEEKPEVEIKLQYENKNYCLLSIKDFGIGISGENIPKIFDRFYRVDKSREKVKGGTGLGLSITKMLADKYNIEIIVESELGKGTLFMLKIPVLHDEKFAHNEIF